MKTIAILLIILKFSFSPPKAERLRTFSIGKFSYSLDKEKSYSHDDRWDAAFYVVRKPKHSRHLCSAYISAKRNDSVFIKGRYLLFNNRIEFIENYYYNKNAISSDSSKKTFFPDKLGNLVLKEVVYYKNGVADYTKY